MPDTLLTRLARFAVDLQSEDLPPGVVERVRLQHLSTAGAIRQLSGTALARELHRCTGRRGPAVKSTGGTGPVRDALRLHSTLAAAWSWEDQLFMGSTSVGGVTAAWALAKGCTVADLVRATAAANEVAGRLGAALLIGPDPADACGEIHALAATTAAGVLEGLDAHTLAHAMALAVAAPSRMPFGVLAGDSPARGMATAQAVVRGLDAVGLAKKGVRGPLDALGAPDGVLDRGAWIPLRAAFTGLGQAWLSQTLAYKQLPAPLIWQAPLQALREVLRRHVKAADKRLRADQVEGIELALPGPSLALAHRASGRPATTPWAVPWRLSAAVGVLVADHDLCGRTQDPEVWAAIQDRVSLVASKVSVAHDWGLTMDLAQHTVDIWAPLLAGVTAAEIQEAARASRSVHGVPRSPGAAGLLALIRTRPSQLLEQIRYGSGNLADARIDEWQYRLGAKVRVHTTRGGTWPEDREIPEASPGWSWDKTRTSVFQKLSGADGDQAAAAALCDTGPAEPADAWVRSLLLPA